MSNAKQPDLGATAASTFHETFSVDVDEETGAAAAATTDVNNNSNNASAQPSASASVTSPPPTNTNNGKGRMIWVIAGTAALLFIIALSVGLATKSNNDEAPVASAEKRAIVPPETVSNDADSVTLDEGTSSNPFIPEKDVGDASMMTWTEPQAQVDAIATSPAPSKSPSYEPTKNPTNEPTFSPSVTPSEAPSDSAPTISPTANPSGQPTPKPSVSPSRSPSAAPTKAPTDEPTRSPSISPSATPSKNPTPTPSTSPTLKPTSEPSKKPTPGPSKSPTVRPTSEPTKQPTQQPSNQPTPEPTNQPSKQPTPPPTNQPTPEPTSTPTNQPTNQPSDPTTPSGPFFFGDEFDTNEDLGIEVSRGLNVRLIAKTGDPVEYADGKESKLDYHTKSDAAAVIPMNPNNLDEGYVYVTNSEEGDGDGGVYGIYFDKDGNILEYKALLTGTTDNCGGGISPWNTFISCEEYSDGQCWQIDPVNDISKQTKLGGNGGRYESVAVDNRVPENPVFFTTEDDEEGAMRRFIAQGSGWDALHSNGETSFLNMRDNGTFEWTDDEDAARDSASEHYPNTEGVQFYEGKLYFMAKKIMQLIILDLENGTYKTEGTGKKFYGEGTFGDQPDQNFFGPTRKFMYFTEDGGDSPGVYARYGNEGHGSDGTYFTIFQAIRGGMHDDDETIGIAISPDHKRFYAGIQHNGYIFEFTREDGGSFD